MNILHPDSTKDKRPAVHQSGYNDSNSTQLVGMGTEPWYNEHIRVTIKSGIIDEDRVRRTVTSYRLCKMMATGDHRRTG